MKGQVFSMILLTFFVFINTEWINNDNDVNSDSDKYPLLKQKETSTFIEAHRKFQNDSLDIHNILRARHCVSPLVLDEETNIRAQIYAEHLARKDGKKLIHSTDAGYLFGENLYAIRRKTPITNLSAFKVVLTWYAEIALYNYNNPGYNESIGHFSQIVWKDTEKLGVGYATAREGRKMFVVAQYEPPGNYNFEYKTCVLQLLC
ncbi:unnamed protein product [Rotaria sordida]|uniref:SCP domain-containing protein n=1 Tax=Rotaria sordida TaxID=392033 RepID=A0A819R8X5_9BILA|nr:unnamed protein product [Rotaria sordida]CAF4044020.1 unnamed protein product [Rotaria sordida]